MTQKSDSLRSAHGSRTGLALGSVLRATCVLAAGLLAMSTLSGCLVAGVSSNGGAFLWPGGFGLLVIILLVVFLLRRR